MSPQANAFTDGEGYERLMGRWSQPTGLQFLDWLDLPKGLRWLDVGCGNGAFTEMLLERCAPAEVAGIDPSEPQLAFARPRFAGRPVRLDLGDAAALPYADASFDLAVMALVIFFVPDPARGVAEMARVVRPGGSVSAYAWDILGGGFPFAAMQQELAALGAPPLWPPSVEAAALDALRGLWSRAGLVEIETREIVVERRFESFEAYWRIALTGPRIAPKIATMPEADVAELQRRLRARLPADAAGRIRCEARANAVKGRVPAR